MKTIILAIALALASSSALAQQRIPTELIGEWCILVVHYEEDSRLWIYNRRRGQCRYDSDGLTVTRDGYRTTGDDCKLVKVTTDTATRVHRMRFRCYGDVGPSMPESSMQRAMGVLLVRGPGEGE